MHVYAEYYYKRAVTRLCMAMLGEADYWRSRAAEEMVAWHLEMGKN